MEAPEATRFFSHEHLQQQVGLPWSVFAASLTLQGLIRAVLGFILGGWGSNLVSYAAVLGVAGVQIEVPLAFNGHCSPTQRQFSEKFYSIFDNHKKILIFQ